tara:strand:+ start:278 stop:829 length:552 start_codon:yes stop_codon:yes gene_type:complete
MYKDYFQKLTGILFKPLQVLEEYKTEKGISKPLIFMGISVIISGLISVLFSLILGSGIITALITDVTMMAIAVSSTFIGSAIFHLFVKLFGGVNPYYQTFKAFAYLSAFTIVQTLIQGISIYIPVIIYLSSLISLWTLVLLGSCLKFYTDLSTGKLVGVWVSSILSMGVIGVLFVFIRNMFLV